MIVHGHVQDGVVVFDQPGAIPNGTPVAVQALAEAQVAPPDAPSAAQRLGNFLSHDVDLPPDAALQHDHYLHGHPKR